MTAGIAVYERQAAAMQRQLRDLRQNLEASAAPRRTAVDLAGELGIVLDPWQRAALETDLDLLLLWSRQAGKGVIGTLLALHGLISDPGSTTVIVAPAERQAKRLLKRVRRAYRLLRDVQPVIAESQTTFELRNGSEVLAMPGSETTIRGVEAVDLLLVDEAALVDDELYASITPMLAVSNGRTAAFSTARGKRGWYFREYTEGGDEWHRSKVTAHQIPRIDPGWLEKQRAKIGEFWFSQEYLVEFLDSEDSVFATDLIQAAANPNIRPLTIRPRREAA